MKPRFLDTVGFWCIIGNAPSGIEYACGKLWRRFTSASTFYADEGEDQKKYRQYFMLSPQRRQNRSDENIHPQTE